MASSFQIAARAILELGAELISSDGIALYELLKNAVDADSPQVKIEITVALRLSTFELLLSKLGERAKRYRSMRANGSSNALAYRRSSLSEMRTEVLESLEDNAPEECLQLTERFLTGHTTFRTFRRSLERLYDRVNQITVSDTGEGMSLEDLRDVYLTIGTRSRQRQKPRPDGPDPSKVFLGEKGVGRLSTMRLGGMLTVKTTKAGEQVPNRLDIDWDWFSHESDRLLSEIRIHPRKTGTKRYATESGTQVIIRRLRSDWTESKFKEIVLNEFSRLVDPFESRRAARLLRLYYNGTRHYPAEIEQRLFEIAHAECRSHFGYEAGKPVIRGMVNYRLRGRERAFLLREPELRGFVPNALWPALLDLGPFQLQFWWFNRAALTDVPGLGKRRELQQRVARWAGGLMLFRDGFRINPYGSPDDDWLGLDKRAFASRGFKLNRQQVIGRVSISWRNHGLQDQTNREGLTETPQKNALTLLLQQILFKEFKTFIDKCDAEARVQELTTIEDLQAHVERARTDIGRKLRELIKRVPSERAALQEVERLVNRLNGYIDQARELAEEYESDRSKFVYLAGIGLMVEFILHELGRATSHTLATLRSISSSGVGSPKLLPATFHSLDDQLTTLVKRIDTLDPLSTSRRQRKEEFDVGDVIRQVIDGRRDQARRHGVNFQGNFEDGRSFSLNGVRGMFIQILENLLSNSFYWVNVQREIDPNSEAWIEVYIDATGHTVSVTDSGTGVDPMAAAEIFDAFVSHRPTNSGRGLGLYISRELAKYHDWTLELEQTSTVRPGRFNTFVLDLSSTAS